MLYHFTTLNGLHGIFEEATLKANVAESFLHWSRVSMTKRPDLHYWMKKAEVRLELDDEAMRRDGLDLKDIDYGTMFTQYAYEQEVYCECDISGIGRYVSGVFDLYDEEHWTWDGIPDLLRIMNERFDT